MTETNITESWSAKVRRIDREHDRARGSLFALLAYAIQSAWITGHPGTRTLAALTFRGGNTMGRGVDLAFDVCDDAIEDIKETAPGGWLPPVLREVVDTIRANERRQHEPLEARQAKAVTMKETVERLLPRVPTYDILTMVLAQWNKPLLVVRRTKENTKFLYVTPVDPSKQPLKLVKRQGGFDDGWYTYHLASRPELY